MSELALPAAPRHVPLGSRELEARIAEAERAVVERDERLRQRTHEVAERLRSQAGRGLLLGAAAGVGVWLGLRFLRRPRRGLPSALPAAQAHGAARVPGRRRPARLASRRPPLPWGRFITFAWPLMPRALRRRVDPRVVTVLGFVLPALASLREARQEEEVPTAPLVDLRRYAGQWYEVGRLPTRTESACEAGVWTRYALEDDAIRVVNRCLRADGREDLVEGEARVADPQSGSKLKVSFLPPALRWLPFAWHDYWILDVDPAYRHALVGTPDRTRLWLLSRTPDIAPAEYQRLMGRARDSGFDTSRVIRTRQS
jgi:apolipoprotein D and lipocalin family protein